MNFVDTHCHLHLAEFDTDRELVLSRAKEAGVKHVVLVGNDHISNQRLIEQLPLFTDQKITLGIHPHHIEEWTPHTIAWIKEHLSLPQVAAIGETGLDYFKNSHSPLAQEKVMRAQIELALTYHLPVVFHIRDAFNDAERIIGDYPDLQFIMHCFTGSEHDVHWIAERKGFISLSGIVTFANANALQKAAALIPAQALLIETDSPFLAPGKHRGQRAEPAFIIETYKHIAALRNTSVEELAAQVYSNAKTVFGF